MALLNGFVHPEKRLSSNECETSVLANRRMPFDPSTVRPFDRLTAGGLRAGRFDRLRAGERSESSSGFAEFFQPTEISLDESLLLGARPSLDLPLSVNSSSFSRTGLSVNE